MSRGLAWIRSATSLSALIARTTPPHETDTNLRTPSRPLLGWKDPMHRMACGAEGCVAMV